MPTLYEINLHFALLKCGKCMNNSLFYTTKGLRDPLNFFYGAFHRYGASQ